MDFTAEWNGGPYETDLVVTIINPPESEKDDAHKITATNFGHGILSLIPDFIVKTPPGVSTYVRGIPNLIANGIQPLDGVVETDWLPFTFTYNFKFIKPGKIKFEKGQPLFSFFPVPRGYSQEFDAVVSNIEDKVESNREKATEFVKENIALFSKFDKKTILEANKNLSGFIGLKDVDYKHKDLHENISKLIFTNRTPKTVDVAVSLFDIKRSSGI
jgi:hypothetical protein